MTDAPIRDPLENARQRLDAAMARLASLATAQKEARLLSEGVIRENAQLRGRIESLEQECNNLRVALAESEARGAIGEADHVDRLATLQQDRDSWQAKYEELKDSVSVIEARMAKGDMPSKAADKETIARLREERDQFKLGLDSAITEVEAILGETV